MPSVLDLLVIVFCVAIIVSFFVSVLVLGTGPEIRVIVEFRVIVVDQVIESGSTWSTAKQGSKRERPSERVCIRGCFKYKVKVSNKLLCKEKRK